MENGNNWTTEEVEEMIAILKQREILCLPEGKKSRSLDTFKVVSKDMRTNGLYRTAEEIRTKLRTLRKDYFKASKSRNKSAYRACEFFPLLHDLFTDAQKKRNIKEGKTGTNQRHQKDQTAPVASNYHSRSSAIHSMSGSSISSMPSPLSCQNGYDHCQRHKYSAAMSFGSNCDVSKRQLSPVRVVPDKYHLKLTEYQPNLFNSLANLCKNDRYADVMLFVCNDDDNIAIPAHKLILGTLSSYFANIFEKANLIAAQTVTFIVLPPMVTRFATQHLLQYMYTGETIVSAEKVDEVMLCGNLLRVCGFCKKKGSSMFSQNEEPELVSLPLVSVTKNLSMDPTQVCNQRKRKSTQTPRSTPSPTPSRSPTPPPVPRREKSLRQPLLSEKPAPAPAKEVQDEKQRTQSVTPTLVRPKPETKKVEEQRNNLIRTEKQPSHGISTSNDTRGKQEMFSERNARITTFEKHTVVSQPIAEQPESPPSLPPSPAYSRASRASLPRPVSPPTPDSTPAPAHIPEPTSALPRKILEKSRSPPRDIIDELDNMVTLTSDESMMEIVTKSPESRNSPFSTHTHSPISPNEESGSKLEALIEFDYDELNLPNTSMDDQPCVDLDNEDDHQEGTPLDQLVCSRLNCQLCYESFTTPTDWVQHVSGHCIMDQGLLKRRRISSDDGNSLDSAFRCDMCSSYFISAYDWQTHVADAHEGV